jgi:hypothetical protein
VFTAFGVVAGVGVTLLLAQVLHLNDVIRDLRFGLQDAADECDRLEDRLKVANVLIAARENAKEADQ